MHVSFQHDATANTINIGARNSERPGSNETMWDTRVVVQLIPGGDLEDIPQIHYCNTVADVSNRRQAMGDD